MLIALLYVLCIIFCIAFVTLTHAALNFVFDGNYMILQALLELCMDAVFGLMAGRFLGRKLLYINLKNTYKNKNQKKKEK